MRYSTLLKSLIGMFSVGITPAMAQEGPYINKTLEELLNVPVTSAAGREQNLGDVANAMYVITREDIERSGARNVPDLLYRVPGLQVRKIDGHQYGVGIRGEAIYTTNNLLVLVDGAVVFNPMIAGVLWENLPVSLNEIERIEIIRGNPGVLYSSNAVNGVINIITKSADSAGNYVDQRGGTQSYRDSSLGAGGKLGNSGLALRAYFENRFDQGYPKTSIGRFSDRYLSDRSGARMDYTISDHQRLSVLGNNTTQNSNSPDVVTGLEVKAPGETSTAILNYSDKVTDRYDYTLHIDHVRQLGTALSSFDATVDTTSGNTQHNFHYDLLGSHITSVGAELRFNKLNVAEDLGVPFQGLVTNGKASQKVISFFAQDEYRPIEKLILTAGIREDSNSLVINEKPLYSPRVSALYHLTENHSIWASASETYRTPDFEDHDISIFNGFFTYRGSTNLKPEESLTQQLGYRGLFLNQKLKADATLFRNTLNDVIILDGNTGITSNSGSLSTYGAELTLDYQLNENLSLSTDYSYVYPHMKPQAANTPDTLIYDTAISHNVTGIGMRFTKNHFKLDIYAKYFDGFVQQADLGMPNTKIRGYYKSFLRVSYDFQIPVGGRKLDSTVYLDVNDALGRHQAEFNTISTQVYTKPEATAGITVKF